MMRIVHPDAKGLQLAADAIKKGGVVVYPTDTAYALGGFFDSGAVTKKILAIKRRTDRKFTLVAADIKQVEKFFSLNRQSKKVVARYWPGPLSLAVSSRFAVRVPDHRIAITLARRAGKPLIATSANISGTSTLYDSRAVVRQFLNKKKQPDVIIDAGRLRRKKTSTVVRITSKKITVIRPGAIPLSSLIA